MVVNAASCDYFSIPYHFTTQRLSADFKFHGLHEGGGKGVPPLVMINRHYTNLLYLMHAVLLVLFGFVLDG